MRAKYWVGIAALLVAAACGPTDVPGGGDDDESVDAGGRGDGGGGARADAAGAAETCGNGFDDDRDGMVDEGCSCTGGATQSCYPGDPAEVGRGPCATGTQACGGGAEFGAWGPCADATGPEAEACDGVDNDCNGTVDDTAGGNCMVVSVPVNIDGDCVTAMCPAAAPYPIGCDIVMSGGDSRGCVASTPTSSTVYFQEGDVCGAGHVSGTLLCASEPGMGLDETNCVINKATRYYPPDRNGCPDT